MFLFRWPTALWVRGHYSRGRVSACPALWHLGKSTSLIRDMDAKWKCSGSTSRWLHCDPRRLYKPANRQQRGEKLAWGHISVHDKIYHVWRTQQELQCHSNRSVHTISTILLNPAQCYIVSLLIFLVVMCRQDHQVPTDSHNRRGGGGLPHCTSCCGFTVEKNH